MNAQDLEQRAREYQHVLDMLGVATHEEAGAEIGRLHAVALRQQPAPVDLEQFREAVEALLPFAEHSDSCGDLDSYNNASTPSCGCGLDGARERLLSIIDNADDAKLRDWSLRMAEKENGQITTAGAHGIEDRPAPVVDDARMARALEWVQVMAMQDADGSHVPAIQEAIAAYDPNCGGRTVRVVDDELPGMWSQSDFMGGAADAADDARQLVPSVDDAMVDRYLAAQAKAVQEIDDALGNGGKAASYLHPVREACRAGLTAALTAARAQGVQS